VGVGARLSRNASMYRPFWASVDGRRRRKRARRPSARALSPAKRRAERQKLAEEAERQHIAVMTPEEYARHIGLSEDQVARVRRIAQLRERHPGGPAAGRGRVATVSGRDRRLGSGLTTGPGLDHSELRSGCNVRP
jgi:hypothetical protein